MDPRQAVAVLVAYMNSGELDVSDAVRTAAVAYNRACQALNDRLAYCAELVKSNQRSEAIRQATLEPDVLREYATLDHPELARWPDTARHEGLAVPPRLNGQVAQRLHGAFAAEQAVAPLLQQYRLLALTRAPLYQRLDVLRNLARAEPTNPAWGEDLRAHEAARFSEIRDVLNDPEQASDLAVIRALDSEVRGAASRPQDVVDTIERRMRKITTTDGTNKLRELNPQLLEATRTGNYESDEDFNRVKELHARAEAAAERYGIPPTASSMEPYHRAGKWLKDARAWRKRRAAFDQTVEAIRVALAQTSDWEYVRDNYRHLLEFPEFEIPDDVAEQFAGWAGSRRLLSAAVVGLALVAVLSGVVIYFAFLRG